jgi:hypothetical protein
MKIDPFKHKEKYLAWKEKVKKEGTKEATKDIDIVVTSKADFHVFDRAMTEKGFVSMTERESEFYLTALAKKSIIFNLTSLRIFLRELLLKT